VHKGVCRRRAIWISPNAGVSQRWLKNENRQLTCGLTGDCASPLETSRKNNGIKRRRVALLNQGRRGIGKAEPLSFLILQTPVNRFRPRKAKADSKRSTATTVVGRAPKVAGTVKREKAGGASHTGRPRLIEVYDPGFNSGFREEFHKGQTEARARLNWVRGATCTLGNQIRPERRVGRHEGLVDGQKRGKE